MHLEYKTFLDLFLSIARFSCDQSESVFEPDDADGPPDEGRKSISITQDEFFSHLYEPRNVVQQLKENLRTTNLICLVGPPGSGKSTIVLKLNRELREDRLTNPASSSFMELIDLRVETETNTFDLLDAESIEKSLRDRLVAAYLEEFFPLTRAGDNPRLKLWAFLLDSEKSKEKPRQIFSVFQRLQDRATKLLRKYDLAHPGSISVHDWLQRSIQEPTVQAITEDVDKLIDFPHLVYAAASVQGIKKQVIWLDNVDKLSARQQTDTMLAARKLFTPVATKVGMGVSIREENVFRDYELNDDKAVPYETRVLLEIPRGTGGHAFYPSRDIPVATDKVLRSIINRRLEFTRRYQRQRVEQLSKLIEESTVNTGEESGFDVELLTNQMRKLTPVITPQRYAIIEKLSTNLLGAMAAERAIYLANNSLRDFMVIFRDCLADLLKTDEPEEEPVKALSYERWYLSTLFLRRARHTQRRYKVGVYDILAATDKWFKNGQRDVGCLLPHLIITTIWNLTLQRKIENSAFTRSPPVGEVISRLALLGFNRNEIIEEMHALYLHNFSRQNLIEFRSRSVISSSDQIKDDISVYLTYRGKCIVARTSNSFGYIYDCLRLLGGDSHGEEILIDHPKIRSREEVINELLPLLCDVAQMHVQALKEISTNDLFAGDSWPYKYLDYFGVPKIPPYIRGVDSGAKGAERRFFQLDLLLLSLMIFVHTPPVSEKLQTLRTKFMDAVESLKYFDKENPINTPDFRKELDV
jgi:energy-coupling factor transporter ATP-binding protein EcfA2